MNIKKGLKINKVELSAPFGRQYLEIQFDDNNVGRVYLTTHKDSLLTRVFVFDDNDNDNDNYKLIKLSKENLGLLNWMEGKTCDISYDVRKFDENIVMYFAIDMLIIYDKDYKYIEEKVSLGVGESFEDMEE